MHSIGKGIRYFRQAQEDLKTQIRDISAEVEKETNLTAVINSTPESEVKVHAELDATITESISIRPAEGAISIHAPKEEDSNEINQAG